MPSDLIRLEKRLAREQLARKEAEDLLEINSKQLFQKNRELSKLSESLEKLVAKRTSQMQKARDDALLALQVKSDFIANMSHELRTPMNGVLGVLTLLSDEELTLEQQELVSVALTSGKHLLGVINDILDFSKIEAKKVELELSPVNVKTYFQSVCAPFILDAKNKGIEFRFNIDAAVPNVLITDPLRLTQIISNLLSNAIKFTDNGGVFLSFTPFNSKGVYRLTVADSGIGISKEHISTVFAAFEQADTSITRDFGGTGLGMNITKNLVEMFNGEITVESELGEGTTFHVDICFKTSDAALEDMTLVRTVNTADEASLTNSRILLVEDNPVNQMIAMKMLSKWDCHVELADDGKKAIDMLEMNDYHLVLMDLQMPVMGGIEATQLIRASNKAYADVPIVAMTAHNSTEHVEECYSVGMQDHISKPIERESLRAVVLKYLSAVTEGETDSQDVEIETVLIDGIDTQSSLDRLGGDWPLLYSLIERFLQEHADFAAKVSELKQSDDSTNAIILLHKVKGGAGNLGITELADWAGEYEASLINHDSWPKQQAIIKVQRFLEGLNKNFAAVDNPIKTTSTTDLRKESLDYIKSGLEELLTLVNKDLFAAEDILNDILECELSPQLHEELLHAKDSMLKFDTAAVSASINTAITLIG
ncbi:response regulator [Glaciecola sp. MH2013]|uniref:response regulator n=1 Tax=Glaciecola sp. MH2013 TaxID=2785524 RepID=UPI0018A0FF25|nr:response regulator [Glaciecola sp. MH2013]MBF7074865.1 response regulator [Glaciecola sp. MH2013]